MSVQTADIYIPFDRGPGAQANIERWRKMAQLFARTGVVRTRFMQWPPSNGEQNPLMVWFWDGATNAFTVAPGACWVNGFYGRNRDHRSLPNPTAEPGLAVVRLDPIAQELRIVFRPNVGIGGEIHDPNGWWEMPLAYFNGSTMQDLRVMTPLEILPPPITEIPPWVPRGVMAAIAGPDTQIVPPFNVATNILVAYPSSYGWFVPGRNYKFTFLVRWHMSQGFMNCRIWAADELGLRHAQQIYNGPSMAIGNVTKTSAFVVRNCRPGFVAVIEATPTAASNVFAPLTNRIEIEDVGAP